MDRRLVALAVLLASGCAGLPADLGGRAPQPQPSSEQLADGLREALAVGTSRAVARLGQRDGYWGNPAVRIPLPSSLQRVEKAMRALGQQQVVDDFRLSLNRAAEQAAPEAAAIFADAIRSLTLADARAILEGPPDAATRWFQSRSAGPLADRFQPVVARATDAAGATRRYKELVGKAGRYLGREAAPDVDAYVTERAIAGLFAVLAEEERRIREEPAARTTELLRLVFGR